MNEQHIGSNFDDFLDEEGMLEEAERVAQERVSNHKKAMAKLEKRLQKDRPTETVSIKLPLDVIEDLEKIAEKRGFLTYEGLIRTYVGMGLRDDLGDLGSDSDL